MRKLQVLLALILVIAFVAACANEAAPVAPEPEPEVEVEAPVEPEQEVEEEEEEPEEEEEEPEEEVYLGEVLFGQLPGALPRNETLYFGGWHWGTPINSNPFAAVANNPMVLDQPAQGARVFVFETLHMFNMLTGDLNPLLASGQPEWNDDRTVLTVNLNSDASWSDGSQVTARDVVATFDAHVWVGTGLGIEFGNVISQMVAVDDTTLEIHYQPDNHNTLQMLAFLPRVLIQQADFIEAKMAEHNNDTESFRNDAWTDAPITGPYQPVLLSSTQIVLERRDDYWGQAASMWGRLPVPRYIVHNVYPDNDVKRASFAAGQIDINQQFMSNVWDLWENDGLPVTTFLDEAPYYMPGQMPSIWFNTTRPGLDQRAVRQAIAYAINYDLIIAAAMSGYSPTFEQAPRSIATPLEGEQRFIDNDALAAYQWSSEDFERANAILDEAGIVDSTGDGWREWPPGNNLSFTLVCPAGWTDWNAALEIVAQAGPHIGIELVTNFVEPAVHTEMNQTGDFDITMVGTTPTNIATPWFRAFQMFDTDPDADRIFWGWHRMHIPEAMELVNRAGQTDDFAELREIYTELSRILLYEMPLVYLMYRPTFFHTANESVWTGFPEYGDGTDIPPTVLGSGYGIAALYNLRLVNP